MSYTGPTSEEINRAIQEDAEKRAQEERERQERERQERERNATQQAAVISLDPPRSLELEQDEYNRYQSMPDHDKFLYLQEQGVIDKDAQFVKGLTQEEIDTLKEQLEEGIRLGIINEEDIDITSLTTKDWGYKTKEQVDAEQRQWEEAAAAYRERSEAQRGLNKYKSGNGYDLQAAILDGVSTETLVKAGFQKDDINNAIDSLRPEIGHNVTGHAASQDQFLQETLDKFREIPGVYDAKSGGYDLARAARAGIDAETMRKAGFSEKDIREAFGIPIPTSKQQTPYQWVKGIVAKQEAEEQAALKAEYDAYTSASPWQRMLMTQTVIKQSDGNYTRISSSSPAIVPVPAPVNPVAFVASLVATGVFVAATQKDNISKLFNQHKAQTGSYPSVSQIGVLTSNGKLAAIEINPIVGTPELKTPVIYPGPKPFSMPKAGTEYIPQVPVELRVKGGLEPDKPITKLDTSPPPTPNRPLKPGDEVIKRDAPITASENIVPATAVADKAEEDIKQALIRPGTLSPAQLEALWGRPAIERNITALDNAVRDAYRSSQISDKEMKRYWAARARYLRAKGVVAQSTTAAQGTASQRLSDIKPVMIPGTKLRTRVKTAASTRTKTSIRSVAKEGVQSGTSSATAVKTSAAQLTKASTSTATSTAAATSAGAKAAARTSVRTKELSNVRTNELTNETGKNDVKKRRTAGRKDEEKRAIIKNSKGAITRRQGWLKGGDVWHTVIYPYGDKDHITVVGKKPEGAKLATGPGSGYKLTASGPMPEKPVKRDLGAVDPVIVPTKAGVRIYYVKDTTVSTRRRPARRNKSIRRRPARRNKSIRSRTSRKPQITDLGAGVVESRTRQGRRRHLRLR